MHIIIQIVIDSIIKLNAKLVASMNKCESSVSKMCSLSPSRRSGIGSYVHWRTDRDRQTFQIVQKDD